MVVVVLDTDRKMPLEAADPPEVSLSLDPVV